MSECIICGGESRAFGSIRGINKENQAEVDLFSSLSPQLCCKCGHGFVEGSVDPDILRDYYNQSYWDVDYFSSMKSRFRVLLRDIKSRFSKLRVDHAQSWVEILNEYLSQIPAAKRREGLKTLEIGAALAAITRVLKKESKERLSTDVIEPSDSFDRLYYFNGIRKVAGFFEELDGNRDYDLVFSSHVLEHVVDIHEFVKRMIRLSKPGALLAVEVPNCEAPYWEHRFFPDPPHLNWFTPSSLSNLMQQHGLKVLHLSRYGNEISWEKHIGYLKADSPQFMTKEETQTLGAVRHRRLNSVLTGLSNEERDRTTISDPADETPRVALRVVATIPTK